MKLSDLRITVRLYLAFGLIVAILVALVTLAELGFRRQSDANGLNVHTYEVLDRCAGVLESLLNIETGQRGYSLTGKDGSLEPYDSGKKNFEVQLRALAALTADNPQQQERLKRLADKQREWVSGAIDPAIALRRAAGDDLAAVVASEQSNKGKAGMDGMRQLLSDITGTERALLVQRTEDANRVRSRTEWLMIGGGLLAAALAVLLAVVLGRNISRPLAAAVALAQRVARGDLSSQIEVRSKDETGELMQALRDMNSALTGIVLEVRGGTDTITTAAAEISSGNMDLSSRTEQQASSLEETASSMEELTATVKQNADSAHKARELAGSASSVAVRGGEMVAEVVTTMGTINDSARKIADIIGVIDGIAFQTNILALNAAVEAARAGEQGRGFAVVASEVRNLAQRSASAAKEIKALIDDSVSKVDAGSKLVDRAGATMEEVVASVQRVTQIINDIAIASEEQRNGIEQVNDAITQMDQVTQQNAALVEEAAAAAAALKDQADGLTQAVSIFQLNGVGATAARRQPGMSAGRSLAVVRSY
ncbi:methyl-accepting chemotaxis protein [Duganella sp. 1224]|uniref:methyl-accepting chemotaxis protein n=1 Tax=Duganella sp. 1224 TaxID=2587052 RepID=UPI0015C75CB9|nr:methyl-accepting chemotaxis protein [Duganella sp. 1224]NYE61465.1 methyl-accepting chemotaxis protein [Duganella sp. 1224]